MMVNNLPLPQPAGQIIAELETGLNQIKQNWVEGIYVTGSIPLGDFYPDKSDVDFLVLCKEYPAQSLISQLDKLHRTVQRKYPKPLLNGSYLTVKNLQASNATTSPGLYLQGGNLQAGPFEMGPIALYELKTTAYTITGVPKEQLPIAIELDQVKEFMHANINSYWQTWVNQHSSGTRKGLLTLFPLLTEWAVLGVARQVYTLQTGKIASKRAAGYYCLDEVPAQYHPIIQQAIQIRENTPSWPSPSLKNLYSIAPSRKRTMLTLDCTQYLIEHFNEVYLDQKGE